MNGGPGDGMRVWGGDEMKRIERSRVFFSSFELFFFSFRFKSRATPPRERLLLLRRRSSAPGTPTRDCSPGGSSSSGRR